MSVVLAFYMLLGSFLPGSDWHEVPKIANLVNHFQDHELRSDEDISFIDFLSMHYSGDQAKDQDDHTNLPFQHLCSMAFVALIPVVEHSIAFESYHHEIQVKYTFSVVRDHIPNVWQPPKA